MSNDRHLEFYINGKAFVALAYAAHRKAGFYLSYGKEDIASILSLNE
jgi:hypothetical protein